MSNVLLRVMSTLVVLPALACTSEHAAPPPIPPPPLPVAAAPTVPSDTAAEATPPPAGEAQATKSAKLADAPSPKAKKGASLYDIDPSVRPKKDPVVVAKPADPLPDTKSAPPVQAGSTEPAKPEKTEAPAPPFVAPSSKHVSLDLPSGLKDDLAADRRMKPWLDTAIGHATRCYEREAKSNAGLNGTVEVLIVMHENARPDASLKTLPSQLAGVFTCVSGAMMGVKMPLFTGKEGQRYTARAKFGS